MLIDENAETAFVSVLISPIPDQTVTVNFHTVNNTAVAGQDYGGVSGTLTFSPGVAEIHNIAIPIIPGGGPEGNETFFLILDNAIGGMLVDNDANPNSESWLLTILDDVPSAGPEIAVYEADPFGTPQVPIVDGSAAQINFGKKYVGSAGIIRTFAIENEGTETLSLSGLTIPSGFSIYENIFPTSLAPGQRAIFKIALLTNTVGVYSGDVSFTNNDADENPFNFSITGVVDNAATSLTIDAESRAAPEGCPVPIRVMLSSEVPSGLVVSVRYYTYDGFAISIGDCKDYYATAGTLNFFEGEKEKIVTVYTVEDGRVEPEETFGLWLHTPSNAVIGQASATGKILPDTDSSNGLQLLAIGSDYGGAAEVRVFDGNIADPGIITFYPYTSAFTGGVRVATGDVNGDGYADLITVAGTGGGPHVRVWNGAPQPAGQPLFPALVWPVGPWNNFASFFAYEGGFTGGVFIASGDVNGDGYDDIITGPDISGGPHVRVFSGYDGTVLHDLFAYTGTFTGGVRVAAADFDLDGNTDIVTAPGPGHNPLVYAFSGANPTTAVKSFFAYDVGYTGGLYIATGDLNNDGAPDFLTGPANNATHNTRAFNGNNYVVLADFKPYVTAFNSSVRVAIGDVEGNGNNSIVTVPGPGGGAHVRGFNITSVSTYVTELCSFIPTGTTTVGQFLAVAKPKYQVSDITYVAQANHSLLGDVSRDNPDGAQNPDGSYATPPFGGGWRVFPDAKDYASRSQPRPYVRVTATVTPARAGVAVHFKSFDVDDPSSNAAPIDPNGASGDDNVGTFGAGDVPGQPANGSAYKGRLRPLVFEDFLQEGEVATAYTDVTGKATVELLVSFAPGDNFRVAASTRQIAVESLTTQNVLTTSNPATPIDVPGFDGKVAEQLAVWRRLHIEQDRMQTAQGDKQAGDIDQSDQPVDGIATVRVNFSIATMDEYQNGILRANNTNYKIVANYNIDGRSFIDVLSSVQLPMGPVEVFHDDWEAGNPTPTDPITNLVPLTRIDTGNHSFVYDYMQPSTVRAQNRFADAFIEPNLTALDSFDSVFNAVTHTSTSDPAMVDYLKAQRGSAGSQTDVFWTSYMATAFEPEPIADADPDTETAKLGVTTTVTATEASLFSLVFLESIRDEWDSGNAPNVPSRDALRARLAVHEIGHQFFVGTDMPHAGEHRNTTDNLMHGVPGDVPEALFYFHNAERATLRRKLRTDAGP